MLVYSPDIPPEVAEIIRHLPPDVKRSLKQAIRSLSLKPDSGQPLRQELEGLWKYRVRRFRIIYAVDRQRRLLRVVAVGHRRGIYEAAAEKMRRERGSEEIRPGGSLRPAAASMFILPRPGCERPRPVRRRMVRRPLRGDRQRVAARCGPGAESKTGARDPVRCGCNRAGPG